MVKCQSSEMRNGHVRQSEPGVYEVAGDNVRLTYHPRLVELSDGTRLVHESQGGTLSSVWAGDLGDLYVEVVHLGDGPVGGELVAVIPDDETVLLGDLYSPDLPASVPRAWPEAVDLALGLTSATTIILSTVGPVERDELEAFHQRLLGVMHG